MKFGINNGVIGRILIIVGALAAINTLFPIYLYEESRNWPSVDGKVNSTKILGTIMRFRRAINYTYRVALQDFTTTQMIPRDSWVDELKEGSVIPLRYKIDDPTFVVVDHEQTWRHIMLSFWNIIWVAAGIILLRRDKRDNAEKK